MNSKELEVKKTNQVIEFEKTISDSVQNRISKLVSENRLDLPANYSVGNAINSAWLIIQRTQDRNKRPALEVCTKASIAEALLDMSILGLNPAKTQGYFIVYGNKLTWMTSYFGKASALKRLKGIETEPIATLIYKGDKVKLGHTDLKEEVVLEHEISFENKLNGEIVGAYATLTQSGKVRSAVMTIKEIRESWTMSKTNPDHKTFTGEFVKRTVINRLAKMILNTSNDDELLAETILKNENQHYSFDTAEEAEVEIETNANTGEVIDYEEVETAPDTAAQDSIEELEQTSLFEEEKPAKNRGF